MALLGLGSWSLGHAWVHGPGMTKMETLGQSLFLSPRLAEL